VCVLNALIDATDLNVLVRAVAADIISAVEFDADGSYLATGDKGGRVVLFEQISTQPVSQGQGP
jgi:hypothetical protein